MELSYLVIPDSVRRKFFPLDFFADEAAAGFCNMEGWRNMVYLYQFEGELIPLQVNFKSYLELMLKAKGCFYWQYLIWEIIDKEENEDPCYRWIKGEPGIHCSK